MSANRNLHLKYPMMYQGARMFLINTEDPESALTLTEKIIEDDGEVGGPMRPLHAGFTTKCDGEFRIDSSWRIECKAKGKHGHLVFQCDDGSAILGTPIRSQEFFERYIEDLGSDGGFSPAERNAIRIVLAREIQKLPKEIQPDEKALLADQLRYKRFLRFSWLRF